MTEGSMAVPILEVSAVSPAYLHRQYCFFEDVQTIPANRKTKPQQAKQYPQIIGQPYKSCSPISLQPLVPGNSVGNSQIWKLVTSANPNREQTTEVTAVNVKPHGSLPPPELVPRPEPPCIVSSHLSTDSHAYASLYQRMSAGHRDTVGPLS
ncbi:hypothetical protein DAKH74_023640 [Maudiozyma humilis]|uniref:Uncharacterized protein n=1 Tax=Maudiozyma humilis TaxID=51915 RepID=A0AAV5RWW3_MAUHU|nr:hypothetical protein DAKH74_023640 [Kazachstania humilis]